MWTEIWKWILENFPLMGLLIAVAFVAAFVTVKMKGLYDRQKNFNRKAEEAMEEQKNQRDKIEESGKRIERASAEIQAARESIEAANRNFGPLSEKVNDTWLRTEALENKVNMIERRFESQMKEEAEAVSKIWDSIVDMREDIAKISGAIDMLMPGFTVAHSPVTLSDLGREKAEKMGLAGIVERNWERIQTRIDVDVNDKTPYNIQQYCFDTATNAPGMLFRDVDVEGIKNFAYNDGKPVTAYGEMIGVVIRDEYFRRNSIKVKTVDTGEPVESNVL